VFLWLIFYYAACDADRASAVAEQATPRQIGATTPKWRDHADPA
jgi:hypothetical protein